MSSAAPHKNTRFSQLNTLLHLHLQRTLLRYLLLLLLLLLGYGAAKLFGEWSAEQLEFNHCQLPQEALPGAGPLSIALLSDVHNNRELMERCVEEVEKQKPDLIVFGGDLVLVSERLNRTRWAIEAMRRLRAVAPTFFILGNQDYEKLAQVERILATAGVPLLRNEALNWQTPSGTTLRVVGLGDWNEGDEAPERCLAPRGQTEGPVLLLSHDPESRHLLRGYGWHLMLSGHTHAGQLGIPFTNTPICFRSDMPAGHYVEDGRHHIVTRGVGSIYHMRFFCPPEMLFIHVGQSPRG